MSDKLCLRGSVSLCFGDLEPQGAVEMSTLQTSKIREDEPHLVMPCTRTHDKELQNSEVCITT